MKLRSTTIGGEQLDDDYIVRADGRSVGRIRLSSARVSQAQVWIWCITVPLPIPTWGEGIASSLEEAKAAFKTAWDKFSAALSYDDVRRWHSTQDARSADV